MRINSNSTKQLQAVMDKIETFPNRIASAQQSALMRTSNNLAQNLYRKYPASKYLSYEISTSGKLGYRMTISPEKGAITSTGGDSYIAASVFLKGRKSYTVSSRRENMPMFLRDASVPPYPRALWTANIPAMRGNSDEIKSEARKAVIKNLEYAIMRFGFGPRGGATGLVDLPRPRSRAK
jgi:hypothetical protein